MLPCPEVLHRAHTSTLHSNQINDMIKCLIGLSHYGWSPAASGPPQTCPWLLYLVPLCHNRFPRNFLWEQGLSTKRPPCNHLHAYCILVQLSLLVLVPIPRVSGWGCPGSVKHTNANRSGEGGFACCAANPKYGHLSNEDTFPGPSYMYIEKCIKLHLK